MYRNLDVLRAIAVTLVFGFHLATFKGYLVSSRLGLLGVLLFFVHTSMVLLMSLERHNETWSAFMVRRLFRIFPLSLVIVFIVNIAHIPQSSVSAGAMRLPDLGSFGLLANLLLFQNLSGHPSSPGVLWSLPYEIQMYALLPALFILAIRNNLLALGTVWVGSILLQLFQNITVGAQPDFLSFVPCFVSGVIAFSLKKRVAPFLMAWTWPLFLAITIIIFTTLPFRGANPVICLVTGLAIPLFYQIPEGFFTRSAAVIAKYSYGIYLSHLLCIWLAFMKCSFAPDWVQWSIFTVLAIAMPVFMFHVIEQPMITVGVILSKKMSKKCVVGVAIEAA